MLAAKKDMTAALVKIIGTAHGLFALWSLLIVIQLRNSELLTQLSAVQAFIKLTATFFGIAFMLLCMWFSWQLSANAASFAWLALGTFLVAAFSDTVALRGPKGFLSLIPTFYKAVLVRAAAALALSFLLFGLPQQSLAANNSFKPPPLRGAA